MFALIWPEVAGFLLAVPLLLLIGLDILWKRDTPPADGRDQGVTTQPVSLQPNAQDACKLLRAERSTRVCVICWFPVELDDVAVGRGVAGCVCLRCFARVTETERPMPAALRRALIDALAEARVP
jgi:hypothetical protein